MVSCKKKKKNGKKNIRKSDNPNAPTYKPNVINGARIKTLFPLK